MGGSRRYRMTHLQNTNENNVDTLFGKPSHKIVIDEIDGVKVVFLAYQGPVTLLPDIKSDIAMTEPWVDLQKPIIVDHCCPVNFYISLIGLVSCSLASGGPPFKSF